MKIKEIFTLTLTFSAVAALSFFSGYKISEIKNEATDPDKTAEEIETIKQRLDKYSELIDSIIKIDEKSETTEKETDAAETEPTDSADFEYIIESGKVTLTKYKGSSREVKIPDKIEQLPVAKIGSRAFAETRVRSVTIPESCTEIDWLAFYGCYALSTVAIPQSVEIIEYGAFDSCSSALTLYCPEGSYAQRYAGSFGIPCELLD